MSSDRKSGLFTQKEVSENKSKPLRFFDSPIDSFKKSICRNMDKHQSLPDRERYTKEVCFGAAIAIADYPISYKLFNLEKTFYSKGTVKPIVWEMTRMQHINTRFVSPIAEELLFRGALLYGLHEIFSKELNMKDKHAATAASLANSLLFSAAHSKGMRLPTFVGGMMYSGITYYCNGSLVPAISAHIGYNNIAVSVATRKLGR